MRWSTAACERQRPSQPTMARCLRRRGAAAAKHQAGRGSSREHQAAATAAAGNDGASATARAQGAAASIQAGMDMKRLRVQRDEKASDGPGCAHESPTLEA
ncbi:hypothetical protein SEVIR_4G240751v4 [Setaria viridis]